VQIVSRWAYATIFFVCLSACGGGGGSSGSAPPPAPAPTQSPGGIWFGSDSEGDQILALITESGRFHFLELTTGNQGSGTINVSNGNQISTNFRFVPAVGNLFADGSPYSDCSASGTIVERSTLNGTIVCTTSMGSQSSVTVNLAYDARYELGSDLATFAGEWTDSSNPGIDVVNIDSVGAITGQDESGTGCVYSGQVSIIDSTYNAYDVEWTYSSCSGQFAILNGITFSGIGAIDNTVSPIEFTVGATAIIQGDEVSLILTYERTVGACSMAGQKEFVLTAMQDWYLWNNLLPINVNLADYATPEELLAFLTTFSPDDGSGQPIDKFSFIGSAAADAAFFGEGQFEGFGFSSRFVAADDLRLTQVFANSPADLGGLARGQRILELNGRTIAEIQAAEGVSAVFGTSPLTFTMLEPGGTQFISTIAHDIVTINPVPQWRVIDAGGGRMVGYMEFSTFISTADPVFDTVFAAFQANGVNDVIIDLRYNGGGLVSTAELLGDFLGGDVAENLTFSKTLFNADRAAVYNAQEFFERLGNSMSLSRLVVIATSGTASASELVTNSMEPHVEVTIVGDRTFGKPVGQVGFEFCEKILRPTAFQTVNADDFGDYFGGLPVDCVAADDLDVAVGADTDPNMVTALGYLDAGSCPVASLSGGQAKPVIGQNLPQLDRRGRPWREFADAF